MIEIQQDQLVMRFPEVHPEATVAIEFERTLRVPDDAKKHLVPPSRWLGKFPLRSVADCVERVPAWWMDRAGVMLPMYQSEALLIRCVGSYPLAVKVATGPIDAITGRLLSVGLERDPQNYLVVPEQRVFYGYCVEKEMLRQFVAMPLGSGYGTEAPLTAEAERSRLQIVVIPMKISTYRHLPPPSAEFGGHGIFTAEFRGDPRPAARDPYALDAWDFQHSSRCSVHLVNSRAWRAITGEQMPTIPPTAREYTDAGLPWFAHYDEGH